MNEPTAVKNAMLRGLTGAIVGACTMFAIGFVKHGIRQRDTHRN